MAIRELFERDIRELGAFLSLEALEAYKSALSLSAIQDLLWNDVDPESAARELYCVNRAIERKNPRKAPAYV